MAADFEDHGPHETQGEEASRAGASSRRGRRRGLRGRRRDDSCVPAVARSPQSSPGRVRWSPPGVRADRRHRRLLASRSWRYVPEAAGAVGPLVSAVGVSSCLGRDTAPVAQTPASVPDGAQAPQLKFMIASGRRPATSPGLSCFQAGHGSPPGASAQPGGVADGERVLLSSQRWSLGGFLCSRDAGLIVHDARGRGVL
jgi:hypothetical protein